jgi:hypothetical protein
MLYQVSANIQHLSLTVYLLNVLIEFNVVSPSFNDQPCISVKEEQETGPPSTLKRETRFVCICYKIHFYPQSRQSAKLFLQSLELGLL